MANGEPGEEEREGVRPQPKEGKIQVNRGARHVNLCRCQTEETMASWSNELLVTCSIQAETRWPFPGDAAERIPAWVAVGVMSGDSSSGSCSLCGLPPFGQVHPPLGLCFLTYKPRGLATIRYSSSEIQGYVDGL